MHSKSEKKVFFALICMLSATHEYTTKDNRDNFIIFNRFFFPSTFTLCNLNVDQFLERNLICFFGIFSLFIETMFYRARKKKTAHNILTPSEYWIEKKILNAKKWPFISFFNTCKVSMALPFQFLFLLFPLLRDAPFTCHFNWNAT